MKKILIIDNTFDPPHGCPEIRVALEGAAKDFGPVDISFVRAPEGQIPENFSGIDGVVLSGSRTRIGDNAPWIEQEMAAIRKLYAQKIPTFGICYGEQLIARTLGGEKYTGVAKNYEFGWVEVETKANSPIFQGLPSKFHTFEFHIDEVRALPENFQLVASSVNCPVQAYVLADAPIWGVQFHPERGVEQGKRSLERRLQNEPECILINPNEGERLFNAQVGAVIFHNFLRLVWTGQ